MTSTLFLVVFLSGSACAAITRLFVEETGLFGVFVRLRNVFPSGSQGWQILNCQYCFGVYCVCFTTALAMVMLGVPAIWFIILAPAGLGGAYALLGLAAMIR